MNTTFQPTKDVEVAEWAFHLGGPGPYTSGGCFPAGTTITFDNMSLINKSRDTDDYDTNQDWEVILEQRITGVEANQVGYYPNLRKQATVLVEAGATPQTFTVVDGSGSTVYTGTTSATMNDADSGQYVQVADFSDVTVGGTGYTVVCNGVSSKPFNIGDTIYDGVLKDAMNYYYQNRSGVPIESQYITSGDKQSLSNTTHVGHNQIGRAHV